MNTSAYTLSTIRHSTAHVLAQAILELYPDTLLTIGPATKEGFFYDILPSVNLKEQDLEPLTLRMQEIVARNLSITHYQINKQEARKIFAHNPFKMELIDQIPGETVGIAQQGEFIDLCKGDHVAATGQLAFFKLLHLSGAYWRADRTNQALQRITGTAFRSAEELAAYEQQIYEAQKYDHRVLGKEYDLFSFNQCAPGFPFFHPKGQKIIITMGNYIRRQLHRYHYQEISTPQILNAALWEQSGHAKHYRENMYFCCIDQEEYAIKPMNCPGAILTFSERPRSYRELPLRLAEFGKVHRHELSGALHGLFRVRSFTQDDGHIFCTPDQIKDEIRTTIQLARRVFNRFGFQEPVVHVSTRPADAMGNAAIWDRAINDLKEGLQQEGLAYTIAEGDGAFYGPKIDFHIKDSMQRTWQCGTIQLDLTQPENFNLEYTTHEGTKARPVIIHRALMGSFERFFAIVLEHYKGRLPAWLAPIAVAILPISDQQNEIAQSLYDTLHQQGISTVLDTSSDPLSGKIKRAQLQQIPMMVIIGAKEAAAGTYTLRHVAGSQEQGLTHIALMEKILKATALE